MLQFFELNCVRNHLYCNLDKPKSTINAKTSLFENVILEVVLIRKELTNVTFYIIVGSNAKFFTISAS